MKKTFKKIIIVLSLLLAFASSIVFSSMSISDIANEAQPIVVSSNYIDRNGVDS